MISLSIIIPAYNEEQRIVPTLESLRHDVLDAFPTSVVEVIVVCDGCTDATVETVWRWGRRYQWLRIIPYHINRGKGYALRKGFSASSGRFVMFMDADGATPCRELLRLLPLLQTRRTDVVIASRRKKGALLKPPQPFSRRMLGRLFSYIVRIVLNLPYNDTQCGFKLFEGMCGRHLFKLATSDGFAIDVEILLLAELLHYRVREEGVEWHAIAGSTVNPLLDGFSMLRKVKQLRHSFRRLYINPDIQLPVTPLQAAPRHLTPFKSQNQ